MSTQLLFYERVTPVSPQRHGNWSIERGRYYAFARRVNSVPLMAVEIPRASREYSIVFAGDDAAIVPVVILGVEGNSNLYITEDGSWDAKYVPAFVRRYPFVFASSDDGGTFTLCIDESWAGCNQEGRGDRLFDDQGERTSYTGNVLNFLQEYQAQFRRTQSFCRKLKELDLLETMQAQFNLGNGAQRSVTGFMAVNREKLKALSPETLSQLAKTDELELIYNHLQSMNNLAVMVERGAGRTAASATTSGDGASEEAASLEADASDDADKGNPVAATGGNEEPTAGTESIDDTIETSASQDSLTPADTTEERRSNGVDNRDEASLIPTVDPVESHDRVIS